MTLFHGLHFRNVRGDIYGGVTTAVVALPLALAFGVASGAGAIAGLYGAICVGFFAALFGGTPAQVSGPTGPMTVVASGLFVQFAHEPALAFTVILLGGALQIVFGLLKLGRYIRLMPYPVISGFMSGIGCIIIALQLEPLIGHAAPPGGPIPALAGLPAALGAINADAAFLGALSLAIVYLTPKRVGRLLPAPLIALIVGTLLALVLFPGAPVIGAIPRGLPEAHVPGFGLDALPAIVTAALVLALLGSIDSLLTSLIADNITRTQHLSDRELIGQGIGNMVSGLVGGLPGAGATMRTVVNVRTGGRTPISGALHAVVLLALVLGLAPLAEGIPLAVLAGILIKVGIDIIDWNYLRRVRTAPREGMVMMAVVLALTVVVDLIAAVAVGVIMASLLFVKRMADLQASNMNLVSGPTPGGTFTAEEEALLGAANGRLLVYHLRGPMSFGAAKELVSRLASAQSAGVAFEALVLDLGEVPTIDSSASLALEEIVTEAQGQGRAVYVAGAQPAVAGILAKLRVLDQVPRDQVFAGRLEALRAAAARLGTLRSA